MADKQIIAATLSVNTGNSNAEIKEVNKNANELRGTLSETGKEAKNTSGAIEESGGSFGKLKEQISKIPGPLGEAGEGVNKLSGTFKALLANPIVLMLAAIVAVLALVYKAFINTFEGGEKMEQIFSGIKAAGQALIDNLERMAKIIYDLFTFNFSDAKKQFDGVVDAAKNAYNKAAEFTKKIQALEREQSTDDLDKKKRGTRLALLREELNDESVSVQEKKKIARELRDDQQKNAVDDLERTEKLVKAKIGLLLIENDGARKNLKEINELNGQIEDVRKENALEGVRTNRVIRNLDKQESAEKKAIQKEESDRQKEASKAAKEYAKEQKKLIEERIKLEEKLAKSRRQSRDKEVKELIEFGEELRKEQERVDALEAKRVADNEKARLLAKKKFAELDSLDNPNDPGKKIALVKANLAIENSLLEASDLQRQINAKKASDDIVQIKKDEVDAKKQIAEIEAENERRKVAAISDALGALSEISGKQTAAGKALAIAQTVINTYQAGFAAFKGMVTTIPGPVGIALGVVAAAGAVASGIAAVKKIVAVQIPGGHGGGATTPGSIPLPAAPVAPTASTTTLNQSSINGIGNAAAPIRAYVVDTDSTTHRERNERLNRAARLGH